MGSLQWNATFASVGGAISVEAASSSFCMFRDWQHSTRCFVLTVEGQKEDYACCQQVSLGITVLPTTDVRLSEYSQSGHLSSSIVIRDRVPS